MVSARRRSKLVVFSIAPRVSTPRRAFAACDYGGGVEAPPNPPHPKILGRGCPHPHTRILGGLEAT